MSVEKFLSLHYECRHLHAVQQKDFELLPDPGTVNCAT